MLCRNCGKNLIGDNHVYKDDYGLFCDKECNEIFVKFLNCKNCKYADTSDINSIFCKYYEKSLIEIKKNYDKKTMIKCFEEEHKHYK